MSNYPGAHSKQHQNQHPQMPTPYQIPVQYQQTPHTQSPMQPSQYQIPPMQPIQYQIPPMQPAGYQQPPPQGIPFQHPPQQHPSNMQYQQPPPGYQQPPPQGIPFQHPPQQHPSDMQYQQPPPPYYSIPQTQAQYYAPMPGPPPPAPVFNFVPPQGFQTYQPTPCTGRKKALLIGINYRGTRAELRGCENDVTNLSRFLLNIRRWNIRPEDMIVLMESNPNPLYRPTKQNMINGMRWLASGNQAGDSLLFHFSGHGGRQEDKDGDESDGSDETILPCDHARAGVIVDDELNSLLVRPLAPGVRLTAIFDCCHSGSALDLPFTYYPDGRVKEQKGKLQKMGSIAKNLVTAGLVLNIGGALSSLQQGVKTLTAQEKSIQQKIYEKGNLNADVIMFSGCKDSQTSADAHLEGKGQGAMSYAVIKALQMYPGISYGSLLMCIRDILRQDFHQIPQISTCRFMDLNQPFVI